MKIDFQTLIDYIIILAIILVIAGIPAIGAL